jgi:aminocarboxymuconate-semialdehyde decarboxylase
MGIDRQLLSPNPLTLFGHGATNDGRSAAGDSRLHRFGLDLIVGYTYEETRAGASFVLGGVFDRHPALDVCVPYGGGAIVFLARRFDGSLSLPGIRLWCLAAQALVRRPS